jgi:homocysteine S-methyltransferase
MSQTFSEALTERVLLADGAIGTEFYRRGVFINRCYDELNISQPDLVRSVHEEYVAAGADILTTNTYGAQRLRLAKFGLAEQLEEIVRGGVRAARAAAADHHFVAGSMGPLPQQVRPSGPLTVQEARATYREQAELLLDEGVDLLLLETFRQLPMLAEAVAAVRELSQDIPLIASVAFKPVRTYFAGPSPGDVAAWARDKNINILGTNCVNGPAALLDLIERLAASTNLPLAAMPNAGQPEMIDGRTIYLATPEYMAEYARRFVQAGARIVGGCCGTTPEMIKEMSSYLQSVEPSRRTRKIDVRKLRQIAELPEPRPRAERSRFGGRLGGEFCISVELDAPRGLEATAAIEGSRLLADAGIQAVNIADGPRATARMSALSLAMQVRKEVDIDVIVHYCCRDRNLMGMQMDLLGAHALGIRNILCVTGDPPKMGNYPDATGVFDLDSVELTRAVRNLNQGIDFGGAPVGGQTDFVIGVGCNPGFTPLEKEIDKFSRKLAAGAEFAFSQPVYDPRLLDRFLKAIRDLPKIPLFVGILPLASAKNAEFLHNEVPGMSIPKDIRARMSKPSGRDAQRAEGIAIAAESLRHARSYAEIGGAYIFPPFGRYRAVLDVLNKSENISEV